MKRPEEGSPLYRLPADHDPGIHAGGLVRDMDARHQTKVAPVEAEDISPDLPLASVTQIPTHLNLQTTTPSKSIGSVIGEGFRAFIELNRQGPKAWKLVGNAAINIVRKEEI